MKRNQEKEVVSEMRRLTLGTITTLLLTLGAAGTAQAETMSSGNEQARVQRNVRSTEAFDLVASAYRGEFKSQGIPSYGQLEQAYRTNQIDAETLVNRAVLAGELSPEAAQDEGYMNAVKLHLRDLADRAQDDD